jgi:hypothetical protein
MYCWRQYMLLTEIHFSGGQTCANKWQTFLCLKVFPLVFEGRMPFHYCDLHSCF